MGRRGLEPFQHLLWGVGSGDARYAGPCATIGRTGGGEHGRFTARNPAPFATTHFAADLAQRVEHQNFNIVKGASNQRRLKSNCRRGGSKWPLTQKIWFRSRSS